MFRMLSLSAPIHLTSEVRGLSGRMLVASQYCFYKKKLYFYNEHDATRELGQFIESGHDSNYFWKVLKDKVNRIYLKRRIKKIK